MGNRKEGLLKIATGKEGILTCLLKLMNLLKKLDFFFVLLLILHWPYEIQNFKWKFSYFHILGDGLSFQSLNFRRVLIRHEKIWQEMIRRTSSCRWWTRSRYFTSTFFPSPKECSTPGTSILYTLPSLEAFALRLELNMTYLSRSC